MSSIQGKIKQYYLIINSLMEHPNQTSEEILALLENEDFNISQRTLFRIIESLRYDFGIEIECNRKNNTYFIDEEKSNHIDIFLHFLYMSFQADFVANNIKDVKLWTNYIHLSSITTQKGIEFLQPILDSIKKYKIIEFKYEKFIESERYSYELQPYLLKEYLNRWYIFGYIKEKKDFRIFGLDRIIDLTITENTFERDEKIKPIDFFSNTVGLTYDEYELQEIILQATEIEAKYLRTQPLHSSQVELDNFKFKLYLTPNYELIQLILMRVNGIEVLKPDWLRKEIHNELIEMIKKYE